MKKRTLRWTCATCERDVGNERRSGLVRDVTYTRTTYCPFCLKHTDQKGTVAE